MNNPAIKPNKFKKNGPIKKMLLEKIKNLPYSKKIAIINTNFFNSLFPDEIINVWDNSNNFKLVTTENYPKIIENN